MEEIVTLISFYLGTVFAIGVFMVYLQENYTCEEFVTSAYGIKGSVMISLAYLLASKLPRGIIIILLLNIKDFVGANYKEDVVKICENPTIRKLFF